LINSLEEDEEICIEEIKELRTRNGKRLGIAVAKHVARVFLGIE